MSCSLINLGNFVKLWRLFLSYKAILDVLNLQILLLGFWTLKCSYFSIMFNNHNRRGEIRSPVSSTLLKSNLMERTSFAGIALWRIIEGWYKSRARMAVFWCALTRYKLTVSILLDQLVLWICYFQKFIPENFSRSWLDRWSKESKSSPSTLPKPRKQSEGTVYATFSR